MNTKSTIKAVTANEANRTFRITTSTGNVFETITMSKDEFQSCKSNTSNDWKSFLKNTTDYTQVN